MEGAVAVAGGIDGAPVGVPRVPPPRLLDLARPHHGQQPHRQQQSLERHERSSSSSSSPPSSSSSQPQQQQRPQSSLLLRASIRALLRGAPSSTVASSLWPSHAHDDPQQQQRQQHRLLESERLVQHEGPLSANPNRHQRRRQQQLQLLPERYEADGVIMADPAPGPGPSSPASFGKARHVGCVGCVEGTQRWARLLLLCVAGAYIA